MTSTGNGKRPSTGTRLDSSAMQMKRSARSATIFSRVSAAPPPLIMQPAVDLVGAVDVDAEPLHLVRLEHGDAVPCAGRSVLCTELDNGRRHALRHCRERLDEVIHRRSGADAHDAAGPARKRSPPGRRGP
jgi:hypothetical protein